MKSKNEKNIFNIYDAYIKCNTCWMWKKPKYANDKIIISIKSDYRDEFLNREFGLDDFNYKNESLDINLKSTSGLINVLKEV